METDEGSRHVLPFQLQFDKPLASQVKMAEWNPEKDLLAMVTEDSKVVLHRFQLAEAVDNLSLDTSGNSLTFEDRTTHFFPPAPKVHRMLGVAPGNWSN